MGQGPLGAQVNTPQLIPRPKGTGWSIRKSMQVTKPEYAEMQVCISAHSLSTICVTIHSSAPFEALSFVPC